jgi:hypothetical protein
MYDDDDDDERNGTEHGTESVRSDQFVIEWMHVSLEISSYPVQYQSKVPYCTFYATTLLLTSGVSKA